MIERKWAMPNKETFKIKPIEKILNKYVGPGTNWIDPFAGFNSPAEYTNDLNPDAPTDEHLDALKYLKNLSGGYVGCIYDPPYSMRQVKECYNGIGKNPYDTTSAFYSNIKNEISRVLSPGAIVISFGWNSCGMGKKRGFKILKIYLVCHGGSHNDTIVVIEQKINQKLTILENGKRRENEW